MAKKAVAYLRVSSKGQKDDGFSLDVQLAKIKAFCFANGLELVAIFKDVQSGSDPERKDWNSLRSFVLNKSNDISQVLVYSFQRWARNTSDGLNLIEELRKNDIIVNSISEFFDANTAQGEFMQTIFLGVGQFDKRIIIEKMTTGKKTMIQQTGKWAGGIAPYGYQPVGRRRNRSAEEIINGRGQLVLDSQESVLIKTIYSLREKKMSYSQMSSVLAEKGHFNREGKPFNKATLHRILNRKDVYQGTRHINHSITLNDNINPQQPSILK